MLRDNAVALASEHMEAVEIKAPGTILEEQTKETPERILIPRPTKDPNDPLVS